MALTASTMLPLGTPLPDFRLEALEGASVASAELPERPVLLMVLCAHCPFVKHVEPELSRLSQDYAERVTLLGLASNSTQTHPQDGPQGLAEQSRRCGWRFPYLLDREQAVARSLRAACTPEFFLFDQRHRLAYRGQLDGSRPGQGLEPDGRDLRAALDAVLAGGIVAGEQTASIGCSIKWHPNQAPDWA